MQQHTSGFNQQHHASMCNNSVPMVFVRRVVEILLSMLYFVWRVHDSSNGLRIGSGFSKSRRCVKKISDSPSCLLFRTKCQWGSTKPLLTLKLTQCRYITETSKNMRRTYLLCLMFPWRHFSINQFQSLIPSLTHCGRHSFIHSFIQSFTHWLIDPLFLPLTRLFIHSPAPSCNDWFIPSFPRSSLHSFDLCLISCMHRFFPCHWFQALSRHVIRIQSNNQRLDHCWFVFFTNIRIGQWRARAFHRCNFISSLERSSRLVCCVFTICLKTIRFKKSLWGSCKCKTPKNCQKEIPKEIQMHKWPASLRYEDHLLCIIIVASQFPSFVLIPVATRSLKNS